MKGRILLDVDRREASLIRRLLAKHRTELWQVIQKSSRIENAEQTLARRKQAGLITTLIRRVDKSIQMMEK